MELVIIGIFALLIFGRRLPEVGRSLGKGLIEFKKGLAGVEDEINHAGDKSPPEPRRLDGAPQNTMTQPRQPEVSESPPPPKQGA